MAQDRGERSFLEDALGILQFRRRPLVSFRRFVVLHARCPDAKALHTEESSTQPLRVLHQYRRLQGPAGGVAAPS
jgi:hypothetical protein